MKKSFLVSISILLTIILLIVGGCTKEETITTTPTTLSTTAAEQTAGSVVGGIISSVDPDKSTVTVTTEDQGKESQQVFPIGPNTEIFINGLTCTLEELNASVAAGAPLNCDVVLDENGYPIVIIATEVPEIASVQGTVSEVNLAQSTITIVTDQGNLRTFDVNPTTGIILGGEVCSLEQLQQIIDAGVNPECSVLYNVNDFGEAEFIEIPKPAEVTSTTGTITDVNLTDSVITVQTSQGEKVYQVDPDTGLYLGGRVCSLTELALLEEFPGDLPCTIVSLTDQSGNAIFVDASDPPDLTKTTGVITNVNIALSTITVQTSEGEKVFQSDPDTGLFLGGRVCSLDELDFVQGFPNDVPCTIYSTTDQSGNAILIDASDPPDLTKTTGVITNVNVVQSSITVQTSEGEKVYQVDPDTGLFLGGLVCDLSLIDSLDSLPSDLLCTIWSTTDQSGNAIFIDAYNPPDIGSVTGTISGVSVPNSTITIMTDQGPRSFGIDPNTGLFLAGQVCSLDDVAKSQTSGQPLSCTVYYYFNDFGEAIYVVIPTP